MNHYVVPCSDAKAAQPAKARHLYVGQMFAHTLRAAEASAAKDARIGADAKVLILSAKFGFVDPETILEPYDVKMGEVGSITVAELTRQAEALGLEDAYCLLPGAYYDIVYAALKPIYGLAHDVYEVNRGIGEQRSICSQIAR